MELKQNKHIIPENIKMYFFFQLTSREKAATDYNQKLKEKFQYHPHIKRISRHRHLPKSIYSQIQEQRIMKEARRRKYVLEHLYLSVLFSNSLLTSHQNQTKNVPIKGIFYMLLYIRGGFEYSSRLFPDKRGSYYYLTWWEFSLPIFGNMFKGQTMSMTYISKLEKALLILKKLL